MSQGIVGIVDFSRRTGSEMGLGAAAVAFLSAAPGKGTYSAVTRPHAILGMRRIPLEAGQQAAIAERDDLQTLAAIHGEFHNLAEFSAGMNPSSGDLDLVLERYRQEGAGFARKLNGLFTLAIIDERERSCTILSDRFGMAHQLYWTVCGDRLYFATHLKSLLSLPGVERAVDPEGLNLFLKYSYITSPWTILKGINKLPPGHQLIYRDERVEIAPFWGFEEARTSVDGWDDAITSYRRLLQGSIAQRLGDPGRTGILLSGGLDSSANVALAARCTDQRVKTFSIGFDDSRFDERPFARLVAQHFNTRHQEYTISGREIEDLPKLLWHIEEPYFEFGLFLTYCGLASAAGEVDAVIGGEGADQMFGTGGFAGARPAAAQYLLRRTGLMGPARAARRLLKGPYFHDRDNWAFKARLFWNRATDLNDWYCYGYDEQELADLHRNSGSSLLPSIFAGQRVDASSFASLYHNTQIHQDVRHYVNENVMVKSGRMADMFDLALRESFLDTEVAEFLVGLEFPYKRGGGLVDHLRGSFTSKLLHRKAMEGILPPEIMNKPKQGGFVPVMIFLNDPGLRKKIYTYLLRSPLMHEYFRENYLQSLFASYETHQQKPAFWANFLNAKAFRVLFLLTFDIWHHLFIEQDPWVAEPPSLSDYLDRLSPEVGGRRL